MEEGTAKDCKYFPVANTTTENLKMTFSMAKDYTSGRLRNISKELSEKVANHKAKWL